MKLIFEKSVKGRGCSILPPCDVDPSPLGEELLRKSELMLPEMSETDISRHYTQLCKRVHGVNCGFYPLGSCTMKYNPRVDEEMAALPGFTAVHPLAPESSTKGCQKVLDMAGSFLCEITGMDGMTFQPAAGAHGEFTGVLLIKQYHDSRGDSKRTKIIVPDSAHGTNPATAAMCGYQVVNIPSAENGCVDLEALKAALGDDTAGLMLTNPNTVGIFDKNILEITKIIHEAGGLNYYDGANLNAIMGHVRPGDMGFDVIHLNLHKTFSTPHGGGGPGAGAVGCKQFLAEFLPRQKAACADGCGCDCIDRCDQAVLLKDAEKTIGRVRSFYGNFGVVVRALCYVLTLGAEGIPEASENAVLNANYMRVGLKDTYDAAFEGICMHEFVLSLKALKKEHVATALDVAKALLDYGVHPPTMYFPLIVDEALMIEPTETESVENLDAVIRIFKDIYAKAMAEPGSLHEAPHHTPVRRLDEVRAAREPVVKYAFGGESL